MGGEVKTIAKIEKELKSLKEWAFKNVFYHIFLLNQSGDLEKNFQADEIKSIPTKNIKEPDKFIGENEAEIGIFDSGIGGLTVFKQLIKRLPNNDYVYLGDTARLPYGIKFKKTVIEYSLKNTKFLIDKGCKIIVVACNTASAYAESTLSKKFNVPIFNVIDSGVLAVKDSAIHNVGIIATPSTIESKSYSKQIYEDKKYKKIISKECPIFVPIVEEGIKSKGYTDQIIDKNLVIFKNKLMA